MKVLQALKMLAQEGWTMIIVTHELNFAKDVAERVILMENGQVVEQNTSAEFFQSSTARAHQTILIAS